jgi:hypothetical protein
MTTNISLLLIHISYSSPVKINVLKTSLPAK